MWEPICREDLNNLLKVELSEQEFSLWQIIAIEPEKWQEEEYGNLGRGFWAVAILGKQVIWYNDIEEGFNISRYTTYGKIDEYLCNQDEIALVIRRLLKGILI